jgi:SAM-dependent MidA family methyltransferase
VSEYLLKYFPYEDFIIYEIGAGNGTLAMDILNYIRKEHSEVYDRTQYNIIEISENMVKLQKNQLCPAHPCVNVAHKSIFHWDVREPAPCFFVAMEVIVSNIIFVAKDKFDWATAGQLRTRLGAVQPSNS